MEAPQHNEVKPIGEAISKSEETRSEKKKKTRVVARARKKGARMRLDRFDKDLLHALYTGEKNALKIAEWMNVDLAEFKERVKKLINRKLLVEDASDSTVIRLGVKGYDFCVLTFKKRDEKAGARTEEGRQKTLDVVAELKEGKLVEKEPGPAETGVQEAAKETREVAQSQETKDRIDVFEAFEKYGPKETKETPKKQEQKQPEPPPSVELMKPLVVDGKEKCELCKTEFKTTVGRASNPKYGHCFCGAAYHRDCYEASLDSGGYCVRCGKKLKLLLNKQSEEAVKDIKPLFD
ncbi:hypothetical protein HY991_01330 [Candidatus Micrarchaeota archaeon]|nr:hypothetical protein [Candidatus Micrarchaeota archaeon]